jgi:hypothetical protein
LSATFLFAPPPPAPWDKESTEFMLYDLGRSALGPEDLGCYPIDSRKYSAPAYCIPYNGNDKLYRCRIAREENKYISTPNVTPDLWLPPGTDLAEMYDGELFIVEGEKKAAAVFKYWKIPNVVGIGGCWNAVRKSEKNESYSLIDKLQLLITPGRQINVILDGDVIENKNVGRAALTLQSCIEAMNGTMTLYTPPEEWKGVDDWIYQDKEAAPNKLNLIPFDKLSINRTLLYKQLNCSLNDKGGLIHNELNGAKLLAHHFKSIRIVCDKRLGFIDDKHHQVSPESMADLALQYLQGDISPRYPAGVIGGAFNSYRVQSSQYDLVQDFVKNALKWDGVERLDTWGQEYFETDRPAVASEWGRLLFTGMVLRILEPGTKVDTVLILNGPQGIGKTTFFEDLANIDGFDFYRAITDLPGSTGDDRTFKQTIVSSLIVDLGEGIIFESRKTNTDRLKQFLTERSDEYRVAYAKQNTIVPRGYIFVGTTNRGDQLSDATGSRRFLYLNVKSIKRMDYAMKLQLMAEVAAKEAEIRGSRWYDLRVKLEDLPQALRDEHTHITSPLELMNVEHYRPDALTDFIRSMIESGEQVKHKETGQIIISINYIASMLGSSNLVQSRNTVTRKLSELAVSPTFPYLLEAKRYRIPQMVFHSSVQEQLYKESAKNSQQQFACFVVTKK